MNKLSLVIIAVFLFMSFSLSAQVRGTTWGESIASVKKKEKAEFIYEEDNTLGYKTIISALNVNMQYSFTEGKLSGIIYLATEHYINKNQYIHKYEDLKGQLTKKYGEPTTDNVNWLQEDYKNLPGQHGRAVSMGHVKFMTIWALEDMSITLALYGENYESKLGILYTSTEFSEPVSEVDPGL